VLDASAVTPLALLLLAGAVVTVETVVPDPDAKGPKGEPEIIVVLDSWLRYRPKERHANLVLAFRARVGEMLSSWLAADGRRSDYSGGDAKVVSTLAVILRATGGGDDDTGRADVGVRRTNRRRLDATSAPIRTLPPNVSIGEKLAPKTPPTEEEVARSAAQKLALTELAAARCAAEETAKIEAAKVRSAADAIEVKAATIRLMRQSEDRALAERSKKHTTVATLLKSLELEHCAQKFADAGFDDVSLNDVIDALKEDGEVGAEELAALIERVGLQGGEGLKIKRTLSKPKVTSGGRGENGSRGDRGGGGRGNVKGKEGVIDKRPAKNVKPPPKKKK
jgi:hypothetical protein